MNKNDSGSYKAEISVKEIGDCSITAEDLAGQTRQVFLCKENYEEDFTFECDEAKGNQVSTQWRVMT